MSNKDDGKKALVGIYFGQIKLYWHRYKDRQNEFWSRNERRNNNTDRIKNLS